MSVSACAYYNGLYNARTDAHAADKLSRAGREDEAAGRYASAAARAETVLVRYPTTRWRGQALMVAARSHAFSDDCAAARPRLAEALALPGLTAADREPLLVARGACDVREAHPGLALETLEPLAARGLPSTRPGAALWAARAAIALGDADRARRVLGALDAGAAQWELAQASLAGHRWAAAESLLALRAARGDVRPGLAPMLRTLWLAGERDGVERLVNRWGESGAPAGDKVALHMLTADLQLDARLDALARQHLLAARRLATDSSADAEAAARLTLLSLAPLARVEDVAAAVRRGALPARGSRLQRRLEDNVLLVELLGRRTDASGASLYLAAEVARDSLRASRLAVQLFKRIDQVAQGTVLASRALFAAAIMEPDSAPVLHARLRERYPASPWTLALDGASPGDSPAYADAEASLRVAWTSVALQFADSLKRLRAPAVPAGTGRRTPPASTPQVAPPPTPTTTP
ncbi:MAG: hypothetical protein ACYC3L_07960 [Gemmatimonadaceae bacterium]